LGIERSLAFGQGAELFAQHAVGFDPRFFDFADADLVLIHKFAHGLEQGVDLFLALVQRADGFGGDRGETLFGQLQERFVVAGQRLGAGAGEGEA